MSTENMKLIEIQWNGAEAEVFYTQDFITSHRVVKLDALVDAMAQLKEAYDRMFDDVK